MLIKIKPEIFDGSILEGLPVSFEWRERRPKNVYYVGPSGIVMRNYKSWYDIADHHTPMKMRLMYYHDFGHMLYMTRQGNQENMKHTNFGRNWDNVHRNKFNDMVYDIKDHFIEEIRVSALEFMLKEMDEGRTPMFINYISFHAPIFKIMHYQDDVFDSKYLAERWALIEDAFNYWNGYDMKKLINLADTVKNYLRRNVVPKAA